MTKQELRKVEKLQNEACRILNIATDNGLGEYEALVYTSDILFNLNQENAQETLEIITRELRKLI